MKKSSIKNPIGMLMACGASMLGGCIPLFVAQASEHGASTISILFWRNVMALPFVYLITRIMKVSLRINRSELLFLLVLSLVVETLSGAMLFTSYSYISTGMATALHFFYPVWVMIGSVLFFHEKPNILKLLALVLGCLGVVLFLDDPTISSPLGPILAVVSGLGFAFFLLGIEHMPGRPLHVLTVNFYMIAISIVPIGIWGLATESLHCSFGAAAWVHIAFVAIFVVSASSLLYSGIRRIGATTTSLLSVFEPITSMILGVLLLREEMSLLKILGCLAIVAATLFTAFSQKLKEPLAHTDKL